tara:strand:+ start:215049 stop:216437 length:1389 start_codon:yes stop_codon:yes gene_type:complete
MRAINQSQPQVQSKPVKAAALALFTALLTATTALAMGPSPAEPTFSEDAQFIPADLPQGHTFGQHVSLDNGLFSVGAIYYDDKGDGYSTAYSFKRSDLEGGFELQADAKASIHSIGPRTAISDGVLATSVVANADRNYARSIYLYNATDGSLLREITPPDTAPHRLYGRTLVINDGLLGVGAFYDDDEYTGVLYIYDVTTGDLLHTLVADDAMPGDAFASSIAINDGLIAVGASGHDALGPSSGAIYLFDATTGTQLRKLLADDGRLNGKLGQQVSMEDGLVVAGVSNDWDNGSYAGAMYLFDADTGDQIAKVFPDNPRSYDYFGSAIAISDGIIAVGAEGYELNKQNRVGTAYLFDARTGTQLAQLLPSDPANSFFFASSIDLDGPELLVGSYGPVYFYNVNTIICPADLTGDRALDFFDVSAFLDAFAKQQPSADFTGDGAFDFFDVSAFLDHFAAGCPE